MEEPLSIASALSSIENNAARHSHDTSSIQISSESAPVYSFEYKLRIRAYGSDIGHKFAFGDVLRIQAWVCLRRLALALGIGFGFGRLFCTSGGGIANVGMRDSFGIAQLSGKPGEKRKYWKMSRKELEARRWESACFLFS